MENSTLSKPRTTIKALKSGDIDFNIYLDSVEEHFNKTEPEIMAFIPEAGRFDRLKKEANLLLNKYPNPEDRPELFGLIIGIKDIFHVNGFETKAGSNVPPKALQGSEATSVSQLKEAGALIMGKTVTTEFAYFAPGPTRNPHNINHTPGGSSSGSAAAVAAGLVPVSLGTQTIGSVVRPASFCGIFGYKPSYDRISRAGVIPLSPSLDHIGIFAQNISLGIMVAKQLVNNWKMQETLKAYPTLGIPTGDYMDKASEEMKNHFNKLVRRLKEYRFTIKEIDVFKNFDEIYDTHQTIMSAEAAITHQEWFDAYSENYHDKTATLIQKGKSVSQNDLDEANARKNIMRSNIIQLMTDNQIDLWIAPSAPGPAPLGLESTGDPIMNLPWTQSGLPSINIPAGENEYGLPLGLQVVGNWNTDENLFAWSNQIMAGIQ